jgi:sec-independent protein translocase protein TatB
MFYLFIFESIGTSEVMLIGVIALIVFGPRKLPDMARTIGKTMADFRRSTDDFKRTWQQEIDLENEKPAAEMLTDLQTGDTIKNENTISRNALPNEVEIKKPDLPEIKEINKADFEKTFADKEIEKLKQPEITKTTADKRDWL